MPDMFNGLTWFEALAKDRNLTKALVYGGSESQTQTQAGLFRGRRFENHELIAMNKPDVSSCRPVIIYSQEYVIKTKSDKMAG